ncbi:GntR family transcriptional regulator [Microbacterium sp. PMB16]|uniref:GntR family transcriptional regulator n=1 Tax=Microbacterium sp. PMB16 TaxID=3120157 RepID=UPI003F4BBB04
MADDESIESLMSTRMLRGLTAAPRVRSRSDAVVEALTAAIESGDLAAGDPLSVSALTQRLSVSAATVRSALGVLDGMHLIEHRLNRASAVISPTPSWFVAVVAECSGLSVVGAERGIARASDEQIAAFVAGAARATALWDREEHDQIFGAEALWHLLDLLAAFSGNPYLSSLHASKRAALVLGIRSLSRPRNPVMLRSAVDALVRAVSARDRAEASDIVRDLYTFVVDGVEDL